MKMIGIGPNPNYKLPPGADAETKASWEAIQKSRPLRLPYITAMENVRNSKNMYAPIVEDAPSAPVPGPRLLEDMSIDEKKLMMVTLGIKTAKKMKMSDIDALIRRKLEEIDIDVEEGDGAA